MEDIDLHLNPTLSVSTMEGLGIDEGSVDCLLKVDINYLGRPRDFLFALRIASYPYFRFAVDQDGSMYMRFQSNTESDITAMYHFFVGRRLMVKFYKVITVKKRNHHFDVSGETIWWRAHIEDTWSAILGTHRAPDNGRRQSPRSGTRHARGLTTLGDLPVASFRGSPRSRQRQLPVAVIAPTSAIRPPRSPIPWHAIQRKAQEKRSEHEAMVPQAVSTRRLEPRGLLLRIFWRSQLLHRLRRLCQVMRLLRHCLPTSPRCMTTSTSALSVWSRLHQLVVARSRHLGARQ
jgi:hypothetical protein